MDYAPISAIVPVYRGDNPDHLVAALGSLEAQTHPPAETIVVADGPLTDALNDILSKQEHVVLRQDTNRGQGRARAVGVQEASYNLVAFLDADDIATPERLERQAARFARDPNLDALGGAIAEFADDPDNPRATRDVPTAPSDVEQFARFRSPLNNTTATARRKSILAAGNYRAEEPFEDYRLWLRMLNRDMTLANLSDVLAKVRTGNREGMTARRGGISYAKEEARLFRDFYTKGYVSAPVAAVNLSVRLPIRLVPDRFRAAVYDRLLRR